ncbi:transporter substrate-binding domain-containing protein [Nannocystis punicea]|uniref:Transporter substrate-binding domain-containing protein n=1 Tax=Nannocystis punicea TaxID=2995304 RepID=A0ABY7H709_9BACT|nr:transporter substrate-binding domain-containing protein [Nannocystis poenicansa]WAS94880.1 transporter substrate-binding domain-containing protein [Nannocystis poenicansa]
MRSSTPERLAAAAWLACSCGLPRDPELTGERVGLHGVRVGVVLEPPWACQRPDRPLAGAEVDLVREFARARGLDLTFTIGGETRLLAALRRFEFDLVIGGLVADSPYDDVGFTRAYHRTIDGEHVFAVPPGENAWTMQLEAYLAGADIDVALARGRKECGDS